MYKTLGQLERGDYWLWRHLISEMQLAESKAKIKEQSYAMADKDIEISKLKLAMYKETVKQAGLIAQDAKKAYEEYKLELEQKLGFSFNECVIDDVTFEIKKLEE